MVGGRVTNDARGGLALGAEAKTKQQGDTRAVIFLE